MIVLGPFPCRVALGWPAPGVFLQRTGIGGTHAIYCELGMARAC